MEAPETGKFSFQIYETIKPVQKARKAMKVVWCGGFVKEFEAQPSLIQTFTGWTSQVAKAEAQLSTRNFCFSVVLFS